MKPKDDFIERTGVITETLGSARFKVTIDKNGDPNDILGDRSVVCSISGKMRKRRIRIVLGDKVKLEIHILSDLDSMLATIVFRLN